MTDKKNNQAASLSTAILGKPYLQSLPKTLRTIDRSANYKLYDQELSSRTPCKVQLKEKIENQCLFIVDDLLTSNECKAIVNKSLLHSESFQNVAYKGRTNSRVVLFDDTFSQYIWNKISKSLEHSCKNEDIVLRPLGFDVLRGDWQLSGLNDAFRLNKYAKGDHFNVHRDAQYCPNGDERSILTLIIYLNNIDLQGGTTNFYFKTSSNDEITDLTIRQELGDDNKHLKCYKKISIEPEQGKCVLFSQSMLHESTPVTSGTEKIIIKTDVMLARNSSVGFSVDKVEEADYMKCLNYFRIAQDLELRRGKSESYSAAEYYEKSLSVRYSYPSKKLIQSSLRNKEMKESVQENYAVKESHVKSQSYSQSTGLDAKEAYCLLPTEVWLEIFKLIVRETDVHNLVVAIPMLANIKPYVDKKKIIPQIVYHWGVNTKFSFPDADFVEKNIEACCRVIAVYSVYLLGNDPEMKCYIVNYNKDENTYETVKLKDLLLCAFYKKKLRGTCYKVTQQSDIACPEHDFKNSVDRRYMYSVYGEQFCGVDVANSMCLDVEEVKSSNDEDVKSDSDSQEQQSDQVDNDDVKDNIRDSSSDLFSVEDSTEDVQNESEIKSAMESSEDENSMEEEVGNIAKKQDEPCSSRSKHINNNGLRRGYISDSSSENSVEDPTEEAVQNERKSVMGSSEDEDRCRGSQTPVYESENSMEEEIGNIGEEEPCSSRNKHINNNGLRRGYISDSSSENSVEDPTEEAVQNERKSVMGSSEDEDRCRGSQTPVYESENSMEEEIGNIGEEEPCSSRNKGKESEESQENKPDIFGESSEPGNDVEEESAKINVPHNDLKVSEDSNQESNDQTYLEACIADTEMQMDEDFFNMVIRNDIFAENTFNAGEHYEELVGEINPPEGSLSEPEFRVGAAVLNKLKSSPLDISKKRLCICGIGDSNKMSLEDKVFTLTFNHVVCDFSLFEMRVCKQVDNSCCPFAPYLGMFLSYDDNVKDLEDIKPPENFDQAFVVNIEELQSEKMSFNHAACQCGIPKCKLNQFTSLKAYPYLNHIHVGFVKQDCGILAWSSYGGIAAL